MILHFEDLGQDFLQWTIDSSTGVVTDCRPFQTSVWVGTIVELPIEVGIQPRIITKRGEPRTLNYAVERIET